MVISVMREEKPEFAIVEVMGHRRFGAKVSQVERYGATFLRAEVLTDPPFEQLLSPASLFSVTPCSEDQARRACTRWVVPTELCPKTIPLLGEGPEIDADWSHDQNEGPPDSSAPPASEPGDEAKRALGTLKDCYEILTGEPYPTDGMADVYDLVESTCREFVEAESALPEWCDTEDYVFPRAVEGVVDLAERARKLDNAIGELDAVFREPQLAGLVDDAERIKELGARYLALEGDCARLTRARDTLASTLLEVRSMFPPIGAQVRAVWIADVTDRIDRALIGAGDRSERPKRVSVTTLDGEVVEHVSAEVDHA